MIFRALRHWPHMSSLLAAALLSVAPSAFPQTAAAQAVPTPNALQYGPQLIGAPTAWARGYNGTGIVVVVADSGIDPNHTAFAGKIDLVRSRNFVLNAPGGPYDPNNITDPDAQSHGTHVAGIVLSSAASGVPGMAYGAGLIVLRAIDNCANNQNCSAPSIGSGTLAALNYYTTLDNAFIYNASYGPNAPANTTVWPATIIDPDEAAAAAAALAKGKLIIAANGNDGTKSPVASKNPNGLALAPFVNPANANAGVYQDGNNNYNFSNLLQQPGLIIAVASVGRTKLIAPYSQLCGVTASWCVSAPGGDSTNAPGDAIYSTLPGNTFGYQEGTSMAAPTVSGALAVLAQAYPGYAPRDWAYVLFSTAENVGGMAGDNATYGYGLIRLDRATDGPTTLAAGSNIDVAAQQMTYWSQPLITGGGFTKTGAGYLMIAGRTTATGDVAVNAGALGVGGTLTLQTQLTVAQGASLSGIGRIVGNTTVAGTLDAGQLPNYADLMANNGGAIPAAIPLSGTSPGTLTFQGNVTLTATATMLEGIDGNLVIPGGPGTFDKVIVTGNGANFTAGGTLAPLLRNIVGGNNTYSPALGTSLVIVSAQNGAAVTGNFAALTQPGTGLAANTRLDVVYAATGITLNVTPLNFAGLAAQDTRNPNQQAVGGALDVIRPAPGVGPRGAAKAVLDDLYDDSKAQDDSELEALSGEGTAANPGAILSAFAGVSDVIADRQAMTSLDYAGLQIDAEDEPAAPSTAGLRSGGTHWELWAQGFGRWSHVGSDAGLPGSHGSANGFALGADAQFGSEVRAGAAFGFARSQTGDAGEQALTNSYVGALYLTWTRNAFVLDGRFAAGPASTDSQRTVIVLGVPDIAQGSYTGWGVLGAIEAGYLFDWDDVALKPYAGLTVQQLQQGNFVETTGVGLSFPDQSFTKVTSALGVRAATRFDWDGLTFAPQLRLAWEHELSDDTLVTQVALFGAPFRIAAADPGADALAVGADISVWASDNLSAFVGYTGEFRSNATSQEVKGGFKLAL